MYLDKLRMVEGGQLQRHKLLSLDKHALLDSWGDWGPWDAREHKGKETGCVQKLDF
jgi:hypothetical protein